MGLKNKTSKRQTLPARETGKSIYWHGLLALGLSFTCMGVFIILKPDIRNNEIPSPTAANPLKFAQKNHATRVDFQNAPDQKSILSKTSNLTVPESKTDRDTVEIVKPGEIKLSKTQSTLIQAHGAWDTENAEADALIDKIPEEAFTENW